MSKIHSDKYPIIVMGMFIIVSIWLTVVLVWSAKIAFSLNKNTSVVPVSSNLQQQAIQNAIELFQQLKSQ